MTTPLDLVRHAGPGCACHGQHALRICALLAAVQQASDADPLPAWKTLVEHRGPFFP